MTVPFFSSIWTFSLDSFIRNLRAGEMWHASRADSREAPPCSPDSRVPVFCRASRASRPFPVLLAARRLTSRASPFSRSISPVGVLAQKRKRQDATAGLGSLGSGYTAGWRGLVQRWEGSRACARRCGTLNPWGTPQRPCQRAGGGRALQQAKKRKQRRPKSAASSCWFLAARCVPRTRSRASREGRHHRRRSPTIQNGTRASKEAVF